MNKNKFRLIKNGEIVGFERWTPKKGWEYSRNNQENSWVSIHNGGYIEHDSKEPYVVTDKEGKEVYLNDKVKIYNAVFGYTDCIVKYIPELLIYAFDSLGKDEPYFTSQMTQPVQPWEKETEKRILDIKKEA